MHLDMYKVQAIKEQERLNLGQKNYIANPHTEVFQILNTLSMVYKGSWILKTRGIPYHVWIFHSFYPLLPP